MLAKKIILYSYFVWYKNYNYKTNFLVHYVIKYITIKVQATSSDLQVILIKIGKNKQYKNYLVDTYWIKMSEGNCFSEITKVVRETPP